MKQRLTGGAELDILTASEVKALLREWQVDVAKGVRPIAFNAQGTTDATGAATIGGATTLSGGQLGPAASIWWSIDRIAVRVDGAPAGAFSIYHSQASSLTVIRDVPATSSGFVTFSGTKGLMVQPADSVVVTLAGAGANKPVTISGAAIEIPQALLWRWLAG